MYIGELAKRAGVTASRVRFYELEGLLPPAGRSVNGYREYGARDVKIVSFIDRTQRLGFSLREITAFLGSGPEERSPRGLLPRLEHKLSEIDAHIEEARGKRAEIALLVTELRRQLGAPGDA